MDFKDEELEEILNIFHAEADEILVRMNNNLLELEKTPNNKDLVLLLFRDAHSLKGAARMIGFNTTQELAHKIEDLLGLIRDDQIKLSLELANTIYKTIDLITKIISKSIEQQEETFDKSEVQAQLDLLERVKSLPEKEEIVLEQTEVEEQEANVNFFKNNIDRINFLVVNTLINIIKITENVHIAYISKVLDNTVELISYFKTIQQYDIKSKLEDLQLKLSIIKKCHTTLTVNEIDEIQQNINFVITNLMNLCETNNINVIDYYGFAFDEKNSDGTPFEDPLTYTKVETQETVPTEKADALRMPINEINTVIKNRKQKDYEMLQNYEVDYQILEELGFNEEEIKEKILSLNTSDSGIGYLIDLVNKTLAKAKHPIIIKVLEKILELFLYIENLNKVNVTLDMSSCEILLNAVEYCFALTRNEVPNIDLDMLLQQLMVVKQLFEINYATFLENENENIVRPQSAESEVFDSVIEAEEVKDFDRKDEIILIDRIKEQSENTIETVAEESVDTSASAEFEQKISSHIEENFSKFFDTDEIKTLHVESSKLDTMVNQMGEMFSTKIKLSKHIEKLSKSENAFESWQRDYVNRLNYLRSFGKKLFADYDRDNPRLVFLKQIVSDLVSLNQKFNELSVNSNKILRLAREDDLKMQLLIEEFDSMIKDIRVLPIATVFHMFGRMVRDISQEQDKQVKLTISGSQTSADKKIIEEIKNPLIHIVRNAIDHGIESPDERIRKGKAATGHIQIHARHSENKIVIEIKDDGRGFDIEKIKAKAIEKGLLTEKDLSQLSDDEVMNLVFLPGFSTNDEITSISGRGIGMNIVKSKLAQLNGNIRILSEYDKGCCIYIELPLTMATTKVLLVQLVDQIFAIPMYVIDSVTIKHKSEILNADDTPTILHEGKNVPIYSLAGLLNLAPSEINEDKCKIIITQVNNRFVGLIVDKIKGEQEVLRKRLSPPLFRMKNILGITTLASGDTCLILNISDIMKNISTEYTHKLETNLVKNVVDKKAALRDKKILIVDDSVTTNTLEKKILQNAGFIAKTAENPLIAFELLNQTHFDLIITDMEMPEMNGIDFIQNLKSNELFSDIPVIVVSSITEEKTVQKALMLGAEKYIFKSQFKHNQLTSLISDILLKYN